MSLYRLRNIIIAIILVIISFVLQSTIFSRIPFLGSSPNLILVLTFVYGYKKGKTAGMLMGFFGGLVLDIFFSDLIGYNALVLLIIGFISGIWDNWIYSKDLYVPLLLLTGSDLLYCIVYFVFWFVLRARFHFGYYLLQYIIPEFLLTFVAGVILYRPLTLLIGKLNYIPEE